MLPEFVTTGTRLTGAGVEGSLSVSVYKLDDIATGGYSNFGEMLRRKLPQFGGGIGTVNEAFGITGSGRATISLRNLPLSNTLFLIDGRHTNADINLIPGIAIDRIEILNDGASSVYGSDAVAGVVNVILKRDFEGAEIRTRYGNTTDTDVGEFRVGILAGGKMGRTSMTLTVEHTTRNALMLKDRAVSFPRGDSVVGVSSPGVLTPIATRANRIAGNATIAADGAVHIPGVTNVNALLPLRWFVDKSGAAITTPAGIGQPGFNPAVFMAFPVATPIPVRIAARNAEEIRLNALMAPTSIVRYGPNKVHLPGLSPGLPFGFFVTGFRPQEATSLSLTTDTVISEDLTFFADILLARNESTLQLSATTMPSRTVTATNFWVQQVFPVTTNNFSFTYRPLALKPRQLYNRFEEIGLTAGFKGKLDKWDWQVSYKRDEWKLSRWEAGLDLATYVAALAGTTAATAWNPFTFMPLLDLVHPFAGNQALVERFAVGPMLAFTNRKVDDIVEAGISGDLMEIRNGPIAVALGLQYIRHQENYQPNRELVLGTIISGSVGSPFVGDRETKAIYAEFNVPLLKNFSVSAAGRIEDFSDVGRTDLKPRVSFRWEPIAAELTVRGSWAQGFVAPSLLALDPLARTRGIPDLFNPLTGIRIFPTSGTFFMGNPELQPAESDSYMVGVIYSPKNIRGLTVGVNYYRIEETNIPFRSPQFIVDQWFAAGPLNPANPWGPTATPSPANPTGAQVELAGDGSLWELRNIGPINTGERMTHGIDLFANYFFTNDLGDWAWDASFTEVWKVRMEDFPGAGDINYRGFYWGPGAALGNYGFPVWKGTSSITWKKNRYSGSIGYNFVDGYYEKNVLANPLDDDPVPSYATFDVRLGYKIPRVEIQVNVGVNNLFDEPAPFVAGAFESRIDHAIADPRGRIVWVELSRKW